MALTLSAAAANAMGDALGALLNGGGLTLYTSPRPATVDTAITTQTLLAAPTFGNPAFASAVAGGITANAPTADASAAASGTAAGVRARTRARAPWSVMARSGPVTTTASSPARRSSPTAASA